MVETVFVEVLSDLVMLFIVVILILFLTFRDTKRQDMIEDRYDRLITSMIDSIIKQQNIYKEEIISEVKALSLAISKVSTGIENISSGTKEVQLEVIKMNELVKNILTGVERISNDLDKMVNNVDIISDIKKLSTVNNESIEMKKDK